MSSLSDYVTQQSGLPEAPTDGFSYARRGQDASWQVTYNKVEADAAFAAFVHTHPYVSLTASETVNGNKLFNDNMGIGIAHSLNYGLNVAGSINVGSGSNFFVNGVPVETFVDAPADGEIYGRQNNAWVVTAGGEGGTVSNLSMSYASNSATINNSGGLSTAINSATTSLAGLMSSSDKTLLGTFLTTVDLSYTRTSTTVTITNTGGNNVTLPAASTSNAGVMTASDKTALNNALIDGDVDLSLSRNSTSNTISNTAGNGVSLSGATASYAGLLTSANLGVLEDACQPDSSNWDFNAVPGFSSVTLRYNGTGLANIPVVSSNTWGTMSPTLKAYAEWGNSDRIIGLSYSSTTITSQKVNDPNSGNTLTWNSATTSLAGLMSASDKTKLNGLGLVLQTLLPKMQSAGIITPAEKAELSALI
jgi:hypothetical protein